MTVANNPCKAKAQRKRLVQQQKAKERKARTKRLIERGAIAESLIPNASELTNEQFKQIISDALTDKITTNTTLIQGQG